MTKIKERLQGAKRDYSCSECGKLIPKNSRYVYEIWKGMDGRVRGRRRHECCPQPVKPKSGCARPARYSLAFFAVALLFAFLGIQFYNISREHWKRAHGPQPVSPLPQDPMPFVMLRSFGAPPSIPAWNLWVYQKETHTVEKGQTVEILKEVEVIREVPVPYPVEVEREVAPEATEPKKGRGIHFKGYRR